MPTVFLLEGLDHMNIVVWPVTVPNVVPIMSPRKPQGVVAAEKCHEENFVQTNGKVWCQFLFLKSYTGLFRNGFLGPWWFTSFSDFVIKIFHFSSLPILSKKRGTWYLSIEMIRQEKVPLGFFKNKFILSAIR